MRLAAKLPVEQELLKMPSMVLWDKSAEMSDRGPSTLACFDEIGVVCSELTKRPMRARFDLMVDEYLARFTSFRAAIGPLMEGLPVNPGVLGVISEDVADSWSLGDCCDLNWRVVFKSILES